MEEDSGLNATLYIAAFRGFGSLLLHPTTNSTIQALRSQREMTSEHG